MRLRLDYLRGFAAGIGVAFASVALLAMVAAQRAAARRRIQARRRSFIDGVRPPGRAELAAQPAPEATTCSVPRLESEASHEVVAERW